jgi:hypothetical protein
MSLVALAAVAAAAVALAAAHRPRTRKAPADRAGALANTGKESCHDHDDHDRN